MPPKVSGVIFVGFRFKMSGMKSLGIGVAYFSSVFTFSLKKLKKGEIPLRFLERIGLIERN
jgi:hypothetical protein